MFLHKLHFFYRKFQNIRLSFYKPRNVDVILYDLKSKSRFKDFFRIDDIVILQPLSKEVNVYVLVRSIIRMVSYNYEFARIVNAKIVLSSIDNCKKFLKMQLPVEVKKIAVQNGYRSALLDIFYDIDLDLAKNQYNLDYYFTFGSCYSKKISKYIDAEYKIIGSFNSNLEPLHKNDKEPGILFISTFRDGYLRESELLAPGILWGDYIRNEKKFLKWLFLYANNTKQSISILGASQSNFDKEFDFYKKIDKSGCFIKFYNRTTYRNTYRVVDKYKTIVSIDSSLGYEALSRGSRVAMFSGVRGDKYPLNTRVFGWPCQLEKDGLFWSNSDNVDKWNSVMDNVTNADNDTWLAHIQNNVPNIILRDEFNSKFVDMLNGYKINHCYKK
jgi:surface carbohydrate biosynthesis protein